MSLFSFLKKTPKTDLSVLKTDIHSHLIPGIDDGAQSMDHTIGMLRKFQELGYEKVITTPHVMSDYYKNTPEIILEGLETVKQEIKKLGLTIEIEAAAEYYFDEHLFTKIKNKELLTFHGNHVLFEFSFTQEPQQIDDLVFELLTNGYQPVLAHFERYPYYHGNLDIARKFREKGVLIQLNLNSINGHYGPAIKKQARELIDNALVDVLGSDCHRVEHLHILEDSLGDKYYQKALELDLLNYKL